MQRKHDQDEQDAVDAHQDENSASGAVVEEFQKVRGGFRLALQISPVDKHALQIASFAEDVHKVGQVWPCQLSGSTSSALHANWKTNAAYIIKAKWYVRTVSKSCSHRQSSGGNGSCMMAPTDLHLF